MAGVPGPVGHCRDAGQFHVGLAQQQGQSAGVVSVTAKIGVKMDKLARVAACSWLAHPRHQLYNGKRKLTRQ